MRSDPLRLGKYELQQGLGRGNVAEVWKAFDTQVGCYVAIKIPRPELLNDPNFIPRFEREAQFLAQLHHPNIVQIRDFQLSNYPGSNKNIAYIVMDYVEGQTLANYIHNTSGMKKFPSPTDIVQLLTSIGNAIDYAHQKGLIHYNTKPANILLNTSQTTQNPMGEPMITDFGIAKILGNSTDTVTRSGVETALYTSPEQTHGYIGNELSDIYSLGVILYEICTGVPPFRGDSPTAIMAQHMNAEPPPPALINPHIPPALTMVILRCLAKDPSARFTSASSMVAAVAEAFDILVPENLYLPIDHADALNEPTYYKPIRTNSLAGKTPTPAGYLRREYQAAYPKVSGISTPLHVDLSNPEPVATARKPLSIPTTPVSSAIEFALANPNSNLSDISSSPTSILQPPPSFSSPSTSKKSRKGLVITMITVLIIVLVSTISGIFYLSPKQSSVVVNSPIVGHAYFISSGEFNNNTATEPMDEFLIDLHYIHAPSPGKNYYAWLLGDKRNSQSPPLLLATLTLNRGNVHVLYKTKQNTNLLANTSRFLITEEDANTIPTHPSTDFNTWQYYAELTQIPAPTNVDSAQLSFLDHLRYLLVGDSQLETLGLKGGLESWQLRNIGKILEWATSARDYWKGKAFPLMHNHFIRILDYLDSAAYVQIDQPANTPLLVDPKVALLEVDPQTQTPPGYVANISSHLQSMLSDPGVSTTQHNLIVHINTEMNDVTGWLKQVRQYARQLVHMTDAQLILPSTLDILDAMATQALYAYIGRLAPDTNQIQRGAVQINYELQHLSSFDITSYSK